MDKGNFVNVILEEYGHSLLIAFTFFVYVLKWTFITMFRHMFYNFGVMIPSPVFLESYHVNNKTIYYVFVYFNSASDIFYSIFSKLKKYNAASRRNFWK